MDKKILVGVCTFGLLEFTKLAIQSIRDTVEQPVDFFAVKGKPGDSETFDWLIEQGIPLMAHSENMGFPYSVNDIYDHAWVQGDYDYLILIGNDIIAYPGAIDQLIEVANNHDYLVVSALQYDVKDLTVDYPETKKFFSGSNFVISDFSSKCWEYFKPAQGAIEIADMQLFDIQNMCLYKRSAFDSIGYTDVNFYPAYYVDNDYAMRLHKSEIPTCTVTSARFFHFWSRVLKQGSGGSTSKYFEANKKYYKEKWGGDFGKETLNPPLKIDSREHEKSTIKRWR